ncbi:MAG: hypothetical protein SFU25_11745, partial [Candidatus Caenarcaniphilales bacterium]|nr:hypothetical protein [Candidatus Caenarcaniphilales bacterium]
MDEDRRINIFVEKTLNLQLSHQSSDEAINYVCEKSKLNEIFCTLKENSSFKNPNFSEPSLIWDDFENEKKTEKEFTQVQAINHSLELSEDVLEPAQQNLNQESSVNAKIEPEIEGKIQSFVFEINPSLPEPSLRKVYSSKEIKTKNSNLVLYISLCVLISSFFSLLNQAQINSVIKEQKVQANIFTSKLKKQFVLIRDLASKPKDLSKVEQVTHSKTLHQKLKNKNLEKSLQKSLQKNVQKTAQMSAQEKKFELSFSGATSPFAEKLQELPMQRIQRPTLEKNSSDERDFSEIKAIDTNEYAYPIISSKGLKSYTIFASEIIQPTKSQAQSE